MKTDDITTFIRETKAQTLVWVRLSSVSNTLRGDVNLVDWLRRYFLHLQLDRFIPFPPVTYIAKDEERKSIVILSQSKYSGKLRLDCWPYNNLKSRWQNVRVASFDLLRLQRVIEQDGIADEDEYIHDLLYTAIDDIVV